MKKLLTCLLLLSISFAIAQTKQRRFDIGIHYPLSTGDNFMVFAYDGLLGIDVRYQFADTKLISPKIAFSTDFFIYNFVEGINGGALVLKPRLVGEFNIQQFARLKPFISLGWGFFTTSLNTANRNFDLSGNPNPSNQPNGERFSDNQNGINWGFGASYDTSDRFFITISADFIKLDLDGETSGNRYNENIHTVNLGAGFRF